MIPVGSKNKNRWVQAAGYDEQEGKLYVRFKSATCIYSVPYSLFRSFLLADDVGSFVHTYLYKLPYEKLEKSQ